MSLMERRLQLLLDQHRYQLVAREAERSGRTVSAVIREAIDEKLDDDAWSPEQDAAAARVRQRLATAPPDEAPYTIEELREGHYGDARYLREGV